MESLYKRPKKAIFPSFFHDFFAGFGAVYLDFPSFFAGPGPGPGGTRPGPGPGACEEGWKMCVFFVQHVFFKPYGTQKGKQPSIFYYLFGLFSKYLAPSGAKYREKEWAVTKTGEGRSTNPFWDF